MQTISNFIQRMNILCALIAELLVFLLMLMVTAEIIGRHIFNTPIPGHVESATLSLVLILYMGIAYTQWEKNHIRVDIFISRISGPKRDLIESLILVLCLIPSVLIAYAAGCKAWYSVVENESIVGGVIDFPVWPGRCSVTFGFALLSLTLICQAARHAIAYFNPEQENKRNHE